jgi:hypothetical protein
MKTYLITAVAAAVTFATSSFALAQSYPYGYPPYGYTPYTYGGYATAPYGDAVPSYVTPYGTYPPYTYDPDPGLAAQLRSDFNRGVDTPGR